jgi:ubiquinone/menaquinone biosynthesis C-methylase UbiE
VTSLLPQPTQTNPLQDYFDRTAPQLARFIRRNHFYHESLAQFHRSLIPQGVRVLEVGRGLGDLLAATHPQVGVGIDFSAKVVAISRAPSRTDLLLDVQVFEV